MFPGRKYSFIHGNVTSESEFEIQGAGTKLKGPTDFYREPGLGIFTVPTALKLHFNPKLPWLIIW